MERELESLTHRISELDHTGAEYAEVADRYHSLEHEFRTRDGYSIEAEVGRVLMGLGFRKEDWERQTDEFSGGWPWPNCCCRSPTCCCWTSLRTTWTSKRATGWKNICTTIRTRLFSSRTTVIFST